MNESFCKAAEAVDSGKYLKENFFKLLKYRKALNEPYEPGQPPIAYERQARLLDKLNRDIDRRKTNFRTICHSVVKWIMTVVAAVIATIIVTRFFQPENQDVKKMPQSSIHQQKEPTPQAAPPR